MRSDDARVQQVFPLISSHVAPVDDVRVKLVTPAGNQSAIGDERGWNGCENVRKGEKGRASDWTCRSGAGITTSCLLEMRMSDATGMF